MFNEHCSCWWEKYISGWLWERRQGNCDENESNTNDKCTISMVKGGEVVCSSTVAIVTSLITALAISDTEQTQVSYFSTFSYWWSPSCESQIFSKPRILKVFEKVTLTQALAAQLISSPPLPCSPAEREELSIKLEQLASKQEEEQEAIVQLENQLDGLVATIRQLEEQV